MAAYQRRNIEAGDLAVFDQPAAADHDTVSAMRAAEDERGERIASTGKSQLVQLEQCKISHLADGNLADIGSPGTGRRTPCCPAQRILMADLADAITAALEQERRAHLLHQIRTVVRGRAINADTDADTGLLHRAHRASARGQRLVATRAMGNSRSRPREPLHLAFVEVNAVGEPNPIVEPAAVFEVIERPAIVHLLAEPVLVLGLG
jgi:hypothetical protein